MPRRQPDNRTKNSKDRPALVNAVTPLVVYGMWTQEETALYLHASTRYVRDSSCPKIRLPGNGVGRESMIRYRPEDVIAWVDRWCTHSLINHTDGEAA